MLKPNDLPIVCLPLHLSDEAAAALVEFLHELTDVFERHYAAQLQRHYRADERAAARSSDPTDPPF
jgi:hypothetical protein